MSLYFGYKKPSSSDTEELEKRVTALKTQLATNNSKTNSLESSVFKKDGSVSMTGDMDMSDNAIVGIDDINANNSVVSKKYVDDNLANRLEKDGDLMTGQLIMLSDIIFTSGVLNMDTNKIISVPNPTQNQDAATKKYVDDKVATNANNITQLATRVITLESISRVYTYHFDYLTLDTSWSYPTSNASSVPYHWMFCKNTSTRSKFHVHLLSYDNDASLDSNFTFTFKLDFFKQDGSHTPKEIFTARRGDHVITGERLLFIDKKFSPSTLTGYQDFVMARLAIKGSAVKGNEFTVSCSFEI